MSKDPKYNINDNVTYKVFNTYDGDIIKWVLIDSDTVNYYLYTIKVGDVEAIVHEKDIIRKNNYGSPRNCQRKKNTPAFQKLTTPEKIRVFNKKIERYQQSIKDLERDQRKSTVIDDVNTTIETNHYFIIKNNERKITKLILGEDTFDDFVNAIQKTTHMIKMKPGEVKINGWVYDGLQICIMKGIKEGIEVA